MMAAAAQPRSKRSQNKEPYFAIANGPRRRLPCLLPFVLGFGRENYGRLAQSSIATQFLNYDEINPVPCKAS